jgi:formylglycine-generating enzyme required for sulfatase activity
MPVLDDDLSRQVAQLQQLYQQGLLSEANFRAALIGLNLDTEQIRKIERQIIVQGDYIEQRKTAEPPVSSPTLDADTALSRYLKHVIGSNHLLQLQGIRSSTGLVSIELEEIYITLTATERRTIADEQQWLDDMQHLAPGEARRSPKTPGDRPRESVQQVKVKVQDALRDHMRLVVLGDPGCGKTTLLKYLALTFARDPKGETGLVERRLQLKEARLPILLPLRDFAKHLQENYKDPSTDGPLCLLNFLNTYFEFQDIHLPERFFADRLQRGECLVLLDGVDEVADLPMRHRIARIIEKFTIAYPDNRYVVTSRIVGYTEAARLGEKYEVTTVRDFTWEDITNFVTYWNRSIEIALADAETPQALFGAKQQTDALLKAIENNERVRELAVNPLMLTVIALVQRYRARLPERRAELYEEAIEVLLSHWDVAKGLSSAITIAGRELDAGDRRSLLEPVALWMMEQHAREIEAEDLQYQLSQRFKEMLGDDYQAHRAAIGLRRLISERSGVLVERGQGIYVFSHLTFQEYLAARAISDRTDYIDYTLKHLNDSWWHEVVLLEAGYLSTQGKHRVRELIYAIVKCRSESVPYNNLVLAYECVQDIGQNHIDEDLQSEIRARLRRDVDLGTSLLIARLLGRASQTAMYKRVRSRLPRSVRYLANRISALGSRRRKAASEALAKIGGIYWTSSHGEPEWIHIPAGEFWMGSDVDGEAEKPMHRVNLKSFLISRVLITNVQYRTFVESTAHRPPQHWIDGKVPRGYENHPVIYVSWYDAMAYCKWLSRLSDKIITLPTEAQWEKSARGDLDQRRYPWGNEWDKTRCNSFESGLGSTSAVGGFSEGMSPYGCLDLVGNVYEWTLSLWDKWQGHMPTLHFAYPYLPQDGREEVDAPNTACRVVRGGAYNSGRGTVCCTHRFGYSPDKYDYDMGFRVVAII